MSESGAVHWRRSSPSLNVIAASKSVTGTGGKVFFGRILTVIAPALLPGLASAKMGGAKIRKIKGARDKTPLALGEARRKNGNRRPVLAKEAFLKIFSKRDRTLMIIFSFPFNFQVMFASCRIDLMPGRISPMRVSCPAPYGARACPQFERRIPKFHGHHNCNSLIRANHATIPCHVWNDRSQCRLGLVFTQTSPVKRLASEFSSLWICHIRNLLTCFYV